MIKSLYYFYYLFILFIKIEHKILQFFTRKIIEILEEINNKMHHTLCGISTRNNNNNNSLFGIDILLHVIY